MATLTPLYRHSLALLTDLYQLTMAYGYWKEGLAERPAVFHHFFRRAPFGGRFAIACGLDAVVDFVEQFRFHEDDLAYLADLRGTDDRPLFETAFLEELQDFRFSGTLDAVPEGSVVFPREPLVRVQASLLQGQLLETPLLNLLNFPTLVATKAARVRVASGGQAVLEFGLRRSQGVDGGISASRAAYVGGCDATSNVLAGKLFNIPVKGTHAHSWVMAFTTESEAFSAYGRALPNNTIFLVDTYDTREGVRRAARVGEELRAAGHALAGIRLDSGDLLRLSQEARAILDDAGFSDTQIVASGDLDEYEIQRLKRMGAPIDVWGVGTRLVTAFDQPALGGVYKLTAIQDETGDWQLRAKRSDDPQKSTLPGWLQVRRFADDEHYRFDVLYNEWTGLGRLPAVTPNGVPYPDTDKLHGEDLLVRIFEDGQLTYELPTTQQARARAMSEVGRLPPGVLALENPQLYPVGLDGDLYRRQQELLTSAGGTDR